ncbi:MAG: hypothetical protein ACFFCM_08595 [Promethearchaeota archaeon]
MATILEITEDEIRAFIISELAKQEGIQFATLIGIIAAIVVAVGVTLWYFLHPRSPWVKRRERREEKKDKEEEAAKRKEEQRQLAIQRNLQELDYTCKYCNAPGLKGPKCEYCGHINFSID